jgi:peptidoglycan/LPS O-acetylase OafA/YrhL
VPFARIQFAIYLVHLFIIDRNFWALPSLPYLNSVQAIYFFFADVPFVCLAAFFVCQIIETPWANLEKILLQGPPRKHKEINQPLVSKDLEHKAQY